jgi:hypothetical protein
VDGDAGTAILGKDPPFLRMGLADVDDEEADPAAVAFGELFERPDLGAERRSGVRAEDEDDRLRLDERAQANASGSPEALELEVRSDVAHCDLGGHQVAVLVACEYILEGQW